jgi:hypothetical protein
VGEVNVGWLAPVSGDGLDDVFAAVRKSQRIITEYRELPERVGPRRR